MRSEAHKTQARERQPAGQRGAGERPAVILVADDELTNLSLLKRRLEREHYQIVTARHGGEAVALAQEVVPDLIILDVMMPVLDGMEACRIMKVTPATRDVPVIFLSALDDTETKVSGLSIGADDYISKPFRVEELLARVRVAIRLKRERDRLRENAEEAHRRVAEAHEMLMSDALTGLLNRHGLQRALRHEYAEARRYRRPLSCLMIDIDHFKKINDTYGHVVGDTALVQATRVMSEAVRASDIVCRYGGDEFLVLTPETDLEGASALGEKIRRAAAERRVGDGREAFTLSLSVGAAELAAGETAHEMLARADEALYRAKEGGRNRVSAAR